VFVRYRVSPAGKVVGIVRLIPEIRNFGFLVLEPEEK
jgi:hypothetical protein